MPGQKQDYEYQPEAQKRLSIALEPAAGKFLNKDELKMRRDDGNLVVIIMNTDLNDTQKDAIASNIAIQTQKTSGFPWPSNQLVIENGQLEDLAQIDVTSLKEAVKTATTIEKDGQNR